MWHFSTVYRNASVSYFFLCSGQTKVREYFSVLLHLLYLSGYMSKTVLSSNFLSQRVSCCNFLLLFYVPPALNSLFYTWFTPSYVWALKATRTKVWQRGEVTDNHRLLYFTHASTYFSLFSCFLYSFPSISFPQYLFRIVTSSLVFYLHPLLFPLFSAHSHSVSHVLSPPPSISCSRTVLHGQFTKSGIHSPFSPQAFTTIFNTKPQRWKC